MKSNRLSLLFFLVFAAFSFNSCSNDEPAAPQYIEYKYGIEVLDGYTLIYDITCSYTDVCTNKVVEKHVGKLGENLFYGRGEEVKAKEVVVKVEGKLKKNAKEIVEAAVARHQTVSIGYKCHGDAYVYSDADCTKAIKELLFFKQNSEVSSDAQSLMNYVDNYPTYVICEVRRPVK